MQGEIRTRFLWLDGLRGISALCILVYHSGLVDPRLIGWAWLCVDFFFCLSGFVLARSILESSQSNLGAGHFLKNRIIRIWPVLIIAIVLQTTSQILQYSKESLTGNFGETKVNLAHAPLTWVGAFFLLQIVSGPVTLFCCQLWSLSTEWWVNVLFVFSRIGLRTFVIYFYLFAGIVCVFFSGIKHDSELDWSSRVVMLWAFGRTLISFSIGLLIWKFSMSRESVSSFSHVSVTILVLISNYVTWRLFPEISLLVGLFSSALLVYVFSKRRNPNVDSIYTKILRVLGEASFGIYAYQGIFLIATKQLVNFGLWHFCALIILLISTFWFSTFSRKYIEPKLANFLRKKLKS